MNGLKNKKRKTIITSGTAKIFTIILGSSSSFFSSSLSLSKSDSSSSVFSIVLIVFLW